MYFVSRLFLVFRVLFVPLQYEIEKKYKDYGKKQESTEG